MTRQIRYFSELRAVSCMAIVILHTFFCAARLFQPGIGARVMSMMVRNCMLFAVPCFVMVTGALLLDPQRDVSVRKIFFRYIPRAAAALVVFTFFFALFDFIVDHQGGGASWLIRQWLVNLVTDSGWLHMWYLYMLIGIYMTIPIWRAVAKQADQALIRYVIVLLFLFLSVIPSVGFFVKGNIGFYIMISTIYPLYLFLGYAIHNGWIRISKTAAVLMIVISEAVILLATYFGIEKDIKSLASLGSSYAFAGVVLQAAAVYTLFHQAEYRKDGDRNSPGAVEKVLLAIDRCSFGIYLIHVLVLYTIYRIFQFNPYGHGGFFALLMTAAAAFLISYGITCILKLIPGIRRII